MKVDSQVIPTIIPLDKEIKTMLKLVVIIIQLCFLLTDMNII